MFYLASNSENNENDFMPRWVGKNISVAISGFCQID